MKSLKAVFEEKIRYMGGIMLSQGILNNHMVILPGGCIGFVFFDFASLPGKQKRTAREEIKELRRLGCAACAISEEDQIDRTLCYILSRAFKDPDWYMYKQQQEQKRS